MSLLHRILDKISLKRAYYDYKAKQPTEHLMHSLDHDELAKLLKYKEETGHPQYKKYFNASYWIRQNARRALSLKLNKSRPLNILDIGSGFGYFPYVAKFYGHDVIGIDLPGDVLFNKASEFLNIDRRDYTIEAFTPMPIYDKKFDFVTAFQICFNGHIENELWGEKQWDFFLSDLFKNHMNENGRVYFEMNWSPAIQGWLPDDVTRLFKQKYKANFDGPARVMLRAPDALSMPAFTVDNKMVA